MSAFRSQESGGADEPSVGVPGGADSPGSMLSRPLNELAHDLRTVFRGHPSGLAVLTGYVHQRPVGLLVSSLISVSAVPPVVAFSMSDESNAGQLLLSADAVAVNLLTAEDAGLARHFASKNRASDHVVLRDGPMGLPMLDTHGSVLIGHVAQRVRAGSATVVILDVEDVVTAIDETKPSLVYLDRQFRDLPRA